MREFYYWGVFNSMNKFMNMRVRAKLMLGFGVVMILALLLDASAIISVKSLDDSYTYLLDFPKQNSEHLMSIDKSCSDMRCATTAIMLNAKNGARIDSYWEQYTQAYSNAIKSADLYIETNNRDKVSDSETLRRQNDQMLDVKADLEAYHANTALATESARGGSDFDTINEMFLNGAPMISDVVQAVEGLLVETNEFTVTASTANTSQKFISIWVFSIISVVILLLSLAASLYVSGLISKPLSSMSVFLKSAGETGDVAVTAESLAEKEKHSGKKDEISQMSRSLSIFMSRIREVSDALEAVANGNLSIDFSIQSDKDVLGQSLTKMVDDLNGMLTELRASSEQVSAGAAQISQSAQSLASGSSEQAATIVDFSATINKLMEQTNYNAENSEKAKLANDIASSKLEDSIDSMVEMIAAMKAINESSGNITQIIKVIDDIAFQTNILALNAAVEAARAGQHGKGFAVVADEVRNLAAKSAQAAKETAALIEDSSARVQVGSRIAERTNSNLEVAIGNSRESTKLIELVASASTEQARAISAISESVDQISSVIQSNSALSEQSAASAQEMSAQSILLHEIVDSFRLKNSGIYIGNGSTLRDTQRYVDDDNKYFSNDGKY